MSLREVSTVIFLCPILSLRQQNSLDVINPRLQQHRFSPHIRHKAVVHQRTQPNLNPVRAPEFLLPNEQMNAPIVITNMVHKSSQPIFLDPVDLEVSKRLPVPAPDNRETVSTSQGLQQELLLHRLRSTFSPHRLHPRDIHPPMQRVQIRGDIPSEMLRDARHSRANRRPRPTICTLRRHRHERHPEREILAQAGDVAHVEDLALVRRFRSHGVSHPVRGGELQWRGRVVRW